MAITYLPNEILRKVAKKKDLKALVTDDLKINRAALHAVSDMGVLKPRKIQEIAMKVIRGYRKREKLELENGLTPLKALKASLNNKKLIVNRLQNDTIFEISKQIEARYEGEKYEWLPSDAEEPDPEHQLLYGTIRTIGVGEMPGQRYGCKCGMNILTKEETLDL